MTSNHLLSRMIGLFAATLGGAALAENANYAPGDLILYFQRFNDTNTVYANLGNAAVLFRDATSNRVEFLDLSSTLSGAFGPDWASDPEIYAGVAGVWGDSATETNLQDGDPQRTLYLGSRRSGVGTVGSANSDGYDLYWAGTGAMTSAAGGIQTQNNVLEDSYDEAVEVSDAMISKIDDQNPLYDVESVIYQGDAFGTFAGGVQQQGSDTAFGTFGAAGSVEFALDLYRILARTTISGQVAGPLRLGTYEGTVVVGTNGQVSFILQGGATSLYSTWATSKGLTGEAGSATDPAFDSDPEGDGVDNGLEWILGGEPLLIDPAATLPAATGSTTGGLTLTFNRAADSIGETNLVVEWDTDLTGGFGNSIVVGSSDVNIPSDGINPSVNIDSPTAGKVTVNIPVASAPGGKVFSRLSASQL